MSVAENLRQTRSTLPPGVTLVAVSKFHPVEALREAYDAGQRIFGESREQELTAKRKALPDDVEWHFIGHLQTNKVKYIAPFVTLIQSVDSRRLLDEIDRQGAKNGRIIDCLLEVHIAAEESKSGFSAEEAAGLMLETYAAGGWPNVRIRGLMGMATNTDDETQIRREFRTLAALFRQIASEMPADGTGKAAAWDILSFGMSDDYGIAIEEGSNMVRIGTHIFGEREYPAPQAPMTT